MQQEDTILANAQNSPLMNVSVIGFSVQNRPLRAVCIGSPPPTTTEQIDALISCSAHGNEPAGREAALDFIEAITNNDTTAVNLVSGLRTIIVPTANPDGFNSGVRRNANNEDLNRDWWALNEPETRAISRLIGNTTPYLIIDLHESQNNIEEDNDVEFRGPQNPQAFSEINTLTIELRDRLIAHAVTNGWSAGVYLPGGLGSLTNLDSQSLLRNSVSSLVETNFTPAYDPVDRTTIQYQTIEEIYRWVSDEISDLPQVRADAEAYVIAEGLAGNQPFDVRAGIINPAPLAYQLTGVVPQFHLDVFNVSINGGIISMGQAAQPLIPFLFDELSTVMVVPGVRIYDIPDPVPPDSSVEEFARYISGSHKIIIDVRVVTDFYTGFNPPGVQIPVISGDVQFDATADIFGNMSIVTEGVDAERSNQSLFPRRPGDLLSIYGHEVFIRRGVRVSDDVTLWSSMGYFRIEDVDQGGHSRANITLSGGDRMAGIIEARPLQPIEYPPTATVGFVVAQLVGEVYPNAAIVFDDEDLVFTNLGRTLVVEDNRYAALKEIAEAFGKIFYWDGSGALRFTDTPDEEIPRWIVKAGEQGVLVDSSRRISRHGIYNAVAATGEAGETNVNPVRAVAFDMGETSPTRWGGPFGRVPRFYSSPLIRTAPQAASAATSILRRHLGAPYSVDFGTIPNPALRPWDPIRVIQEDGTRDLHIVDSVTVPLVATATMTGTTREKTAQVIGTRINAENLPGVVE